MFSEIECCKMLESTGLSRDHAEKHFLVIKEVVIEYFKEERSAFMYEISSLKNELNRLSKSFSSLKK